MQVQFEYSSSDVVSTPCCFCSNSELDGEQLNMAFQLEQTNDDRVSGQPSEHLNIILPLVGGIIPFTRKGL